jgi:hypothetical protein
MDTAESPDCRLFLGIGIEIFILKLPLMPGAGPGVAEGKPCAEAIGSQ